MDKCEWLDLAAINGYSVTRITTTKGPLLSENYRSCETCICDSVDRTRYPCSNCTDTSNWSPEKNIFTNWD